MYLRSKLIILLCTIIALDACQRIKRKGADLVDNVLPTYNTATPDTYYNKKRFKEYLKVELTDDIKNIYADGDHMGIDYYVRMTFYCSEETIARIVKVKKLKLYNKKDRVTLSSLHNLNWWDADKLKLMAPYTYEVEGQYYENLWYDAVNRQAYYLEYSL